MVIFESSDYLQKGRLKHGRGNCLLYTTLNIKTLFIIFLKPAFRPHDFTVTKLVKLYLLSGPDIVKTGHVKSMRLYNCGEHKLHGIVCFPNIKYSYYMRYSSSVSSVRPQLPIYGSQSKCQKLPPYLINKM